MNCIAQGLENKFGFGRIGLESFDNRIIGEPCRNLNYGTEQILSSNYSRSKGMRISKMQPQLVANNMTSFDVITKEQVEIIFNRTKEFPEDTELSIAFINNQRVVYLGIKRENYSIITIENQSSVFEIGSITKVFTATLLANCVIKGTLKLEDPINNYLPFKLYNNTQITFKELANHTSGLPRNPSNMGGTILFYSKNPYKNYSADKLEKYLTEKIKIPNKSVKAFNYSNIGFGILGYSLCEIEGKSYNNLLTEQIFEKYGMVNSSTNRIDLGGKLVFSFNKNGRKIQNWDFASMESAGAVLSTAEDLSKFIMAQFNELNRELALTREISFNINNNRAMGLGWFINKTESGEIIYRHKGITGGYKSAMAFNSDNKTGIVILSNVSGFSKKTGNIEALCLDLVKTLVNDK